jgi:hypothetical protein
MPPQSKTFLCWTATYRGAITFYIVRAESDAEAAAKVDCLDRPLPYADASVKKLSYKKVEKLLDELEARGEWRREWSGCGIENIGVTEISGY